MKSLRSFFLIVVLAMAGYFVWEYTIKYFHENMVLKQMLGRLEAESRVAEVLVTGINFNEEEKKTYTTIKFLEFDVHGRPLEPKFFTFSGNIIQFQSLVIRFDDLFVRRGDRLRGKSVYLFWKVFMLDGKNTQEYVITKAYEIPGGYKVPELEDPFEKQMWQNFWDYALDPQRAQKVGIKNAQIEAPGMLFVPGYLYTLKIEHDGGLRIDTTPLPEIIKGETILKEFK